MVQPSIVKPDLALCSCSRGWIAKLILLNGGGPLPAQTSMNDSEGSLTFAHWLGVSYSECLAHGAAGWKYRV